MKPSFSAQKYKKMYVGSLSGMQVRLVKSTRPTIFKDTASDMYFERLCSAFCCFRGFREPSSSVREYSAPVSAPGRGPALGLRRSIHAYFAAFVSRPAIIDLVHMQGTILEMSLDSSREWQPERVALAYIPCICLFTSISPIFLLDCMKDEEWL